MFTFRLAAGHRLTVAADALSSGSYWRLADTHVGIGTPVDVAASNSSTAGPFQVESTWSISSTLGELTASSAVFSPDAETVDGINGAELLQRDGSIPLTAAWDAGPWQVRAETFQSDVATGTAPLTVASTTVVTNLNADQVDGVEAAEISQLGVAQEFTKQHNFNATSLTGLGADVVINSDFTDGADFAVNGAFATDTGWTKGTGWTIGTGVASSDGSQAGDSDLENDGVAVVAGQVYSVVFTVSGYSAGNVTAVAGAQEGTDRAANGTFTELITASDTTVLKLRADADFIGDVDNVTIALVGDAGWTQGVGWLISTGSASSDGSQAGDSDLEDDAAVAVAAKNYEIKFTVSNYSAGNVTAVIGATEGTDRAANGTFTQVITASNTDVLKIRADVDFVGTVDTISMRDADTVWNLDDNQVATIVLDSNIEINNPTNMKDGGIYYLHVKQDGTGSWVPTWGSAFKWPGGTPPTITTTATTGHDLIRFVSDGTSLFGYFADTQDFS